MKISFHGADRGVTGSCHLVECAGKKILVDCGFFQGGRESEAANAGDFGFDRAGVDFHERFGRDPRCDAPLDLAPGARATFVNAAHILGSASVLMALCEGEPLLSNFSQGVLVTPSLAPP